MSSRQTNNKGEGSQLSHSCHSGVNTRDLNTNNSSIRRNLVKSKDKSLPFTLGQKTNRRSQIKLKNTTRRLARCQNKTLKINGEDIRLGHFDVGKTATEKGESETSLLAIAQKLDNRLFAREAIPPELMQCFVNEVEKMQKKADKIFACTARHSLNGQEVNSSSSNQSNNKPFSRQSDPETHPKSKSAQAQRKHCLCGNKKTVYGRKKAEGPKIKNKRGKRKTCRTSAPNKVVVHQLEKDNKKRIRKSRSRKRIRKSKGGKITRKQLITRPKVSYVITPKGKNTMYANLRKTYKYLLKYVPDLNCSTKKSTDWYSKNLEERLRNLMTKFSKQKLQTLENIFKSYHEQNQDHKASFSSTSTRIHYDQWSNVENIDARSLKKKRSKREPHASSANENINLKTRHSDSNTGIISNCSSCENLNAYIFQPMYIWQESNPCYSRATCEAKPESLFRQKSTNTESSQVENCNGNAKNIEMSRPAISSRKRHDKARLSECMVKPCKTPKLDIRN